MTMARLLKFLALVAVAFGALTVFSGARALFGSAEARAALGHVVGFVLWFNFLAGFAYIVVGVALWRDWRHARWAAGVIALATACVAAAFGVHAMSGGAFEARTVGALAFRLGFWVLVSLVAMLAYKSRATQDRDRHTKTWS